MAKLIKSESIIEEKLLPCPFCGETSKELTPAGTHKMLYVVLKKYIEEPESYGMKEPIQTRFFVKCMKCGCSGGSGSTGYNPLFKHTTTEEEAREKAITKWNTRTN